MVAAIETENDQIFTGFYLKATSGVFHSCAERAAIVNGYQARGQLTVKRISAFRDKPPYGGESACLLVLVDAFYRNGLRLIRW